MFRESGARYLVPIHWGTFRLSKEPMDEPLRRLIRDAGPRSAAIVIRKVGGDVPAIRSGAAPSLFCL